MNSFSLCLWTTFYMAIVPVLSQQQNNDINLRELPPSSTRFEHFKFRRRNIGGKNIAAISIKLDPERGRRSILVPDGEGLLHSYSPIRHKHGFPPPFVDEEKLLYVNHSINLGNVYPSIDVGAQISKEKKTLKALAQIEKSLTELEHDLEAGKTKGMNAKVSEKKRVRKRGRGRDGKKKRRRRRKGKQGQNEGKNKNTEQKKKRKRRRKRTKMLGPEACQFKALKKCARRLGLLKKETVLNLTDNERCGQRKEFLECVERQRDFHSCKKRSVARGNMPSLRSWIKKLFWTSSSCLLAESMNGR